MGIIKSDPEVDRLLELERLRADLKANSHTRRNLIKYHLQNGCKNLEYLSRRYGPSVEAIEKAKKIWQL